MDKVRHIILIVFLVGIVIIFLLYHRQSQTDNLIVFQEKRKTRKQERRMEASLRKGTQLVSDQTRTLRPRTITRHRTRPHQNEPQRSVTALHQNSPADCRSRSSLIREVLTDTPLISPVPQENLTGLEIMIQTLDIAVNPSLSDFRGSRCTISRGL